MSNKRNKPVVNKRKKLVYTGTRDISSAMVIDSRTRVVVVSR